MGTAFVHTRSDKATSGVFRYGNLSVPCALGRGGVQSRKREGDGASPRGKWSLERLFYRPDMANRPWTELPTSVIRKQDGWCDAVADRNYNRPVRHPYPASAERMWRDDRLYSVVGVLSHNRRPRIKGLGSAVFLHEAREDENGHLLPTEGCVALKQRDLQLVLAAGLKRIVIL